MLVLDSPLWPIVPLSLPAGLWAYIGLGPGQEFIPQFLAMLGLIATALLAIVQWPLFALWSRLSRTFAARKNAQTNQTDKTQPKE
jgi:hypothetical protein